MRDYQIYVRDDRYSVPTLHLTTLAEGDERAWEIAKALLAASSHHLGVEVRLEGQRLFILGSMDDDLGRPSAAPPTSSL
jgi:hypothetical protein